MDEILLKLNKIEELITEQNLLQKSVLNLNEAAKYLRLSTSCLYHMTSGKEIPHYIPNGKKIYFNREQLDEWLQRNRQYTTQEIEKEASDYVNKNKLNNKNLNQKT